MSDYGFKVSLPGSDARYALANQLVASTTLPNWKCDLRPSNKHYGTINFRIGSLAMGASITIHSVAHGYTYIPSFLTSWSYPAGTGGGASSNQKFGIGDITSTLGFDVVMKTDTTNFTVVGTNNSLGVMTNLIGSIRFYIFADTFTPV